MSTITFSPRWKEELVATSEEGKLIFEITMGTLHVYFPDLFRWREQVPEWAKEKHELYLEECTRWCKKSKIPLSIIHNAHVYEEKDNP